MPEKTADKNLLKLFQESLTNKNTYIPNLLTASRLVGAFLVPGLFLTGNIPGAIIATAAFGATDFLDGKIARATNGYSEFGRVLDPIVDKAFAIIPSLAILPTMPLLAINIGAEAVIASINAKSFQNNGNPQSSFLGKLKTFCLFPTIGLGYLNFAMNSPIINLIANAACLGTFTVQTFVAKGYYEKAKEAEKESKKNYYDQKKNSNSNHNEQPEKTKTKIKTIQNNYSQETTNSKKDKNVNIEQLDLDKLPLDTVPGLIEESLETTIKTTPKTLVKTTKNR